MFRGREPASTIKFVDDYCEWYRKLFPEVRSFEAFKYLHIGMISDIKRKIVPAISRMVGLSNEHLTEFSQMVVSKLDISALVIFGKRPETQYWLITIDPDTAICVVRGYTMESI